MDGVNAPTLSEIADELKRLPPEQHADRLSGLGLTEEQQRWLDSELRPQGQAEGPPTPPRDSGTLYRPPHTTVGAGPEAGLAPAAAVDPPIDPADEPRYAVGPVIAHGGMGTVLEARDLRIGRRVAMKVVRAGARADAPGRFLAEARVTGRLEHPNIVPVHELGFDREGRPYYTMKRVDGVTLWAVVERLAKGDPATLRQFPLGALLTAFQKACDAVAFAHSRGIVHRDLKPENVMVGAFGEVLVMDWGLAKRVTPGPEAPGGAAAGAAAGDGEDATPPPPAMPDPVPRAGDLQAAPPSPATQDGVVIGTPSYMAPEQAAGRVGEIDRRTDVFALGAILYTLLTLRPPFDGDTAAEVLERATRADVTPPADKVRGQSGGRRSGRWGRGGAALPHLPGGRVPASLSAVAMRAMAREPAGRYQTVADLQKDVAAWQAGFATAAEDAGLLKLLALAVNRHRRELSLLAAAAVVLALLTVGFVVKLAAGERRALAGEKLARENKAAADASARRAEAGERKALDTLAELRGTAPTFYEQALKLVEEQNFAEALTKVTYAAKLDPAQAKYALLRGNLLQSLLRLAEARDAYDGALSLAPDSAAARESRDLCARILSETGPGGAPTPAHLDDLRSAMWRQGRFPESLAVSRLLAASGPPREDEYETWRRRLDVAGLPGLQRRADGGLLWGDVSFRGDLSALRGVPLTELNLPTVYSLAVVRGMPLRVLRLPWARVADLRDLKGLPLVELDASHSDAADLAALAGMPLKRLDLSFSRAGDLSALKGLPLEELKLSGCRAVKDLTPLAGMRLTRLELADTGVRDLGVLHGMPIRWLNVNGVKATDFSPLAGVPLAHLEAESSSLADLGPLRGAALEELDLFRTKVKDLGVLRGMPVHELRLAEGAVTDFAQLEGLPLAKLDVAGTQFDDADLDRLRGVPLVEFIGNKTKLTRLSGLEGAPLARLDVTETDVSDLSPLAAAPLGRLDLWRTNVRDLGPLKGKPLHWLSLARTPVEDLSPLAGMPLRMLLLHDCGAVRDLRPLEGCRELENLTIPRQSAAVGSLRGLPHLKRLGYSTQPGPTPATSADEFWKAYDASPPGGAGP